MKALSLKQPWAWLITNGYKDIENRDWNTTFRGEFLIHASKTADYTAETFYTIQNACAKLGLPMPKLRELQMGGIVGRAELVEVVTESDSPWFFGKYGFVLANARPVPFLACKGQLGFWAFGKCQRIFWHKSTWENKVLGEIGTRLPLSSTTPERAKWYREEARKYSELAAKFTRGARELEGVEVGLPDKQLAAWRWLTQFVEEHGGQTPTLNEMTAGLELKSKSMAFDRISKLAARGLVARDPHNGRIILLK